MQPAVGCSLQLASAKKMVHRCFVIRQKILAPPTDGAEQLIIQPLNRSSEKKIRNRWKVSETGEKDETGNIIRSLAIRFLWTVVPKDRGSGVDCSGMGGSGKSDSGEDGSGLLGSGKNSSGIDDGQ